MIDMWSMPGSTPISLSRVTPASRAAPSSPPIWGDTYEVVTMCLPAAMQASATSGWLGAGSRLTASSWSATSSLSSSVRSTVQA